MVSVPYRTRGWVAFPVVWASTAAGSAANRSAESPATRKAPHAGVPDLVEVEFHLALAYRDAGRADDAGQLLAALQKRPHVSDELRARVEEALHSLP